MDLPSSPRRAVSPVRGFVASLLALLALMVGSLPAAAEHPAQYMQRVSNELIAATRSANPLAIATVLRRHADVNWLGTSSLGSYASKMPLAERPNYINGMVRFISNYTAQQAPKYPVSRATVLGASQEDQTGVYVDTRVELRSGESYDVRWLIVRRGAEYKVRDAQVVGFWLSPFLKNLFENYITENGGNPKALVVALNR